MFTGTPEGTPERPDGQAAATGTPHGDGPRLLADIGGTNARFALESGPGAIGAIRIYSCTDFPGIVEAIQQFYADTGVSAAQPVLHAAVAIANPIDGDLVAMTNHDWRFSIEETRGALGLRTLKVVNDFAALAQA
ncbi:MAG: glucokinase, partial [Janthinobacterium lividum]